MGYTEDAWCFGWSFSDYLFSCKNILNLIAEKNSINFKTLKCKKKKSISVSTKKISNFSIFSHKVNINKYYTTNHSKK